MKLNLSFERAMHVVLALLAVASAVYFLRREDPHPATNTDPPPSINVPCVLGFYGCFPAESYCHDAVTKTELWCSCIDSKGYGTLLPKGSSCNNDRTPQRLQPQRDDPLKYSKECEPSAGNPGCNLNFKWNVCGDGYVNAAAGEECDMGKLNNGKPGSICDAYCRMVRR